MQILELIEKKLDEIENKEVLLIGIIMTVGLIFRIAITPWNLPSVASDVVVFFSEAFNFSHNNYELFFVLMLYRSLPAACGCAWNSQFFRFFEKCEYDAKSHKKCDVENHAHHHVRKKGYK